MEVLPNGIVQVQQSTTVRDKLRAEKEARQSVEMCIRDSHDTESRISVGYKSGNYRVSSYPGSGYIMAVSYTHLLVERVSYYSIIFFPEVYKQAVFILK